MQVSRPAAWSTLNRGQVRSSGHGVAYAGIRSGRRRARARTGIGGEVRTNRRQVHFALRFWRLTHWAKRLAAVSPFRQMAGPVASENNFKGSFVPVGEELEVPASVAAPRGILEDYIRNASHRTIIHECVCRVAERCADYPRDLGCLFLGPGSRDVDPSLGREATVEEAMAHLQRALDAGLLPLIGHIRIDKTVFGIRDFNSFLTMCFCCPCCCVVRTGMRNLVGAYPGSLVRLEGVTVTVGEDCVGCGECVPRCPVDNISIVDGKAVVGGMCIGCGTCARSCSRGNITLRVEPGTSMDEDIRRRIEAGVDIGRGDVNPE